MTPVCHNYSPTSWHTNLPTTLDELANTTIIYTTKLKVNGTQLARITNDFAMNKARLQKLKPSGKTDVKQKNHLEEVLRYTCDRYDNAFEERRRILDERQCDLEYLHMMVPFKYSNELAAAIDLQVEATKDLEARRELRDLRAEVRCLDSDLAGKLEGDVEG